MNSQSFLSIGGIVLIFVVMYFLMIRPQKKREKAVNEMRSALKAGDQITTIGGIKGRIVTTRDDSLVIAVGSDKVKIEVMRWAISKIDAEGAPSLKSSPASKTSDKKEDVKEEAPAARKPRKLGAKSDDEPVEAEEANSDADDNSEE